MATISETLRLVFAADSSQFEKGIGASLAQLEVLRGALMDMTAPIDQLQEEMVYMASSFETSMANVSTLLGEGGDDLERYKTEIIALSTEIPQSALELSEALYQAISAGVDTAEAMNFLEAAGKAATAGMTSTFVAVDGGTSVLNAFNLQASESNRVFDLMFQAVRDGKITFEQMSTQMGMLAPTAAAAGIEIEQMFGAIATATGKLRPEQAFTGLAGAITELNTPSSKAEKALKRLGYENLQTALETESLQEILVKLVNSGEKIDAVFGREAARAVNAVGGSAEKATEHLQHMNEAVGATETAFEKVNATFENSQKHLQNVRDAVKISIGQEMMPVLTDWNNLQASILERVQALPGAFKMAAGGGMLLAKGLSGAVNMGGSLARNLVAVNQASSLVKDNVDTLRIKFWDLQDSMKNADGTASNLAKGLGAAGLAAAIAFTMAQLIKLHAAMQDYNAAMKSMQEQHVNYLEWSAKMAAGAKTEDEVLKNNLPTLRQYKQALEDNSGAMNKLKNTIGYSPFKALENILAPNELKMLRQELEAIGVNVETLTEEQLDALIARGEAYQEIVVKANDATAAEVEAAEAVKALSTEEQLEIVIGKLAALGIEFTKTGDAVKDLEKAEKQLAKAQAKAAEERAKALVKQQEELAKLRDKNLDAEQKAWLKAQEGTEAYYRTLEEFEIARFEKERAQREADLQALKEKLSKELGITDDAKLEELEQIKTAHAIIEELEMTHYQNLDAIDLEFLEFKDKRNQEARDKAKQEREQELNDAIALYGGMTDAAMGFFDAIGQAAITGETDVIKQQLKNLLMQTLDYLQTRFVLAQGESLISAIFSGGSSLIANVPLLIAAEGALGIARGMVAAFDTSGMPRTAGMAYVEPNDVILNPNSGEMGVLNALAGQIAGQLNDRPVVAKLVVDGREFTQTVTIPRINQANERVPKGRSVFDESIG